MRVARQADGFRGGTRDRNGCVYPGGRLVKPVHIEPYRPILRLNSANLNAEEALPNRSVGQIASVEGGLGARNFGVCAN